MVFLKNLIFRRFNSFLNPKTLRNHTTTPHSLNFKSPFSCSPQPQTEQNKKSLSTLFTQVMSGNITTIDIEDGEGGETELKKELKQLTQEVSSFIEKTKHAPKKKRLYDAFTYKSDNSVEKTKHVEKKGEKKSVYAAFTNQVENSVSKEDVKNLRKPLVIKELSPDMAMFVKFLYENGYFNDANFTKAWDWERFDLALFDTQQIKARKTK